MDEDGPGHGCRGPVLAAPGQVTSLPAVVLLLDQVIPEQIIVNHDINSLLFCSPRSEGYQVGVVGRGGDGDRPGAPHIGVAQLIGQLLQLIRLKPEHQCCREVSEWQ